MLHLGGCLVQAGVKEAQCCQARAVRVLLQPHLHKGSDQSNDPSTCNQQVRKFPCEDGCCSPDNLKSIGIAQAALHAYDARAAHLCAAVGHALDRDLAQLHLVGGERARLVAEDVLHLEKKTGSWRWIGTVLGKGAATGQDQRRVRRAGEATVVQRTGLKLVRQEPCQPWARCWPQARAHLAQVLVQVGVAAARPLARLGVAQVPVKVDEDEALQAARRQRVSEDTRRPDISSHADVLACAAARPALKSSLASAIVWQQLQPRHKRWRSTHLPELDNLQRHKQRDGHQVGEQDPEGEEGEPDLQRVRPGGADLHGWGTDAPANELPV